MVQACGAGQVRQARQGDRVDPSGQGRAGVLSEPRGGLPDAHQRYFARSNAGRAFGETQGAAVADPDGQGVSGINGTEPRGRATLSFAAPPVSRIAERKGRSAVVTGAASHLLWSATCARK